MLHQTLSVTFWCPQGKCFSHFMKLIIAFHVPFKPFSRSIQVTRYVHDKRNLPLCRPSQDIFIINQWKRLTNEWISSCLFFRNERLIGALMIVSSCVCVCVREREREWDDLVCIIIIFKILISNYYSLKQNKTCIIQTRELLTVGFKNDLYSIHSYLI